MPWRLTAVALFLHVTESFRPAIDSEAEEPDAEPPPISNTSTSEYKTALEWAVWRGETSRVEALLPELLALKLRLRRLAQRVPHLWDVWNLENASDGLEASRRLVAAMKPTDLDILGDMPDSWFTFYEIKLMCANARNGNSSQRQIEMVLASQGIDSFARNYALTSILLSLILFVFGLIVYISFRLRAFGWLEAPVSIADMLPGAFSPERLADADFDPSRQRKLLPYRSVYRSGHFAQNPSLSEGISNFFQALFGVFSSWLLLCVRIPPEKDAFDEEYLTDDDEDCRLKVRDVCAMRAKNVASIEVVVRALSFVGLHAWLVCYAGRYTDAFLLDLLYLSYAWAACRVASSSVVSAKEKEADGDGPDGDGLDGLDAAGAVAAVFGVQHGPRWARAQCTTRSTAAPNKAKRRRRRRDGPGGPGGPGGAGGAGADHSSGNELEKPEKSDSDISDRFHKQLLNAGIMHIPHSSLLEISVVSICSCFLAVVFLLHLRWTAAGGFKRFYEGAEPIDLVQAYGLPDSCGRFLAVSAEMLLMWLCFERLYELCGLLHAATLSFKQRNAALRFLREHQPAWAFAGEVPLQLAFSYVEEVMRCSDFALELSEARWRILQHPAQLLVSLTEALLVLALGLITLPFLPFGRNLLSQMPWLDPVVPLTVALVLVSPAVHMLLQGHFANSEMHWQQTILRTRAERALSGPGGGDDVEYVQLRNRSRHALAKRVTWSSGRALDVWEPILLLYFALIVVGLAVITKLNFIIL